MIHGLLSNLAVVGLFVCVWLFTKEASAQWSRRNQAIALGVLLGFAAIATIAMAVRTPDGVLFDLRFSVLASAAFLEGPVVGIIAGLMAIIFRFIAGGAGWFAGSVGIAIAVAVGIAAYRWSPSHWRTRRLAPGTLIVALAAATLPNLAALLVPSALLDEAFGRALLLQAVLNLVGIPLVVFAVSHHRRRLRERTLLLAAIRQTPDFFYVKDRHSRFVAVNEAVAAHNGRDSIVSLVGKSDFDLDPERAERLYADEQYLMRTPDARLSHRETLVPERGHERVFETTKVPVSEASGDVIGLVGITRDITEASRAERQMHEQQRMLVAVLSKMTDGVALFDEEGCLVFCNEQYHEFFSLTRDVRVPGASLTTILRAAARRREQLDIPQKGVEGWVHKVALGMQRGGDEEVRLFDGRTISVRTKVVPDLGSVSVATDITEMRLTERKLAALVDEMEKLARTDALTGVVNRRALDQQLEREVARCRRKKEPVSLVIIDVDHFKAFNDLHGHPEGDICLKRVANILQSQIRRASDFVARYGGEEFCVVLPDTDEAGALVVAEELRAAIEAARIEHGASETGVVTASLGVATFPAGTIGLSSPELLKMADLALYAAKRGGRNRVMQHSGLLGAVLAGEASARDGKAKTKRAR